MNLEEAKRYKAQYVAGRAGYCPHAPTVKQAEFLRLDCKEALYGGAAGGGKSDALLMAALQYVHVPGYKGILFRRTYTELSLPEAIMARSHEWLGGTDAHWKGDDKTWIFPSGATLTFGYLDGPRDHFRYQGAAFQFVGWDELTQFPQSPYLYLFSRLRRLVNSAVPLRVRAATNPGGVGHDWVERRFIADPGHRVFVPALLEDNPHLDAASYEQSLSELDPVTYQQLRRGLWVRDTSGLCYPHFDEANICAVVPALPNGERYAKIFAADFGVTDPTAFGVLAFSPHDDRVYQLESEQWSDLSPSEAAEIYRTWEDRHGGFEAVIGDTGGLGKAFESEWRKRFAIPMEAADKQNKLGYMKLLGGDIHHKKYIVVGAANGQLVTDMRALAWYDERHQKEHPDLPNHLPDMALYGWRKARHWQATARVIEPKRGTPEYYEQERERRIERKIKQAREEQDEQWHY